MPERGAARAARGALPLRPARGQRPIRVAEVRDSYGADKRWEEFSGELPALLLFRPLSFLVTPLFARAGFSPSGVSWLSGALSLALPCAAVLGGAQAHWLVFAAGFGCQLLDCVDGNLARVTQRTSARGQLLDLVLGQLYWILVLLSLGLLVERRGGGVFGGFALEVALALPWLVLLSRISRNYAELHFGRAQPHALRPSGPLGFRRAALVALGGLENLYIFGIALAGALGGLDWLLLGIAVYTLAVFLYVEQDLLRGLAAR